ncbi:PTS system mannose/fructose/N-acetylgalactosamine-transporter subunit IIB [Levilactobacillus suantsaii]|uniref:PTS mannose/fructose/sorbose transporter subunit IIB n=1 Tax=Levilactobacillus suantsaii TaxID=2292255 RepID=A0A4Q0VI58_9LACO|nr:PTS sugar transporter subunit IIB [Levilactobacillus suantsaii]QMU07054.1 PTS sugar transporter subunit IIB [Levilactobacillus suantsaii]RXI76526.1 PTS mannose/fructose/sorbose transporter subunit IIB [Levilactobacillus suantsaii]
MTMAIQLARVDSRLLHGQVATVWTKAVRPNRILVVSDTVAQDKLRKTLILQAAPPAVKVNVIPSAKMVQIYRDARFDGFRPLILTETLPEMAALVAQGIDLKATGVNVGNLAYTPHRTMLTPSVAADDQDVQAARQLQDAGVTAYTQTVPTDHQQNFLVLAAKKGLTQ